jgi:PAS domain S-box-containing protein
MAELAGIMESLKHGKVVEHLETTRVRKDGQTIQVSLTISPIKDARGQIVGVSTIARDITERKHAEEQLQLQSSVLAAAANAILITDCNGKIEWINPAFTKSTGYAADEVIGHTPAILKSGSQSREVYEQMWQTILAGNVWHGELINKRKDGRLCTDDTTITPVRGANGQITHFVAIKQDVTERRILEDQFRQAQKMDAIGTLAGGIAHDFNNILAAMFGYGNLLQQDAEGNAAAQEDVGEILKAAARAKELVQQILAFSRHREQKRQSIPLNNVVKEVMKFLRPSLPANININIKLDDNAPNVLADPTQIYQVLVNLATNALHAMEGRTGQLTLSLASFQPDAEFIQLHPEFRPIPYARLTVADTGHGMDVKTKERIFEPFFTTKPVGKGTGLGLAVVHGVVQSHEGIIRVESQPGQGAAFHLYFPAQTSYDPLTNGDTGQLAAGHGQRILLLDDEPSLTLPLQRLLVRLNYQVTVSNRAQEAVEVFRQNPAQFDLVITDLTMPEMDGLEVAGQLRRLRPDVPVILTTGLAPELSHEKLLAAGICEVLEKPIPLATLAAILNRTLPSSG